MKTNKKPIDSIQSLRGFASILVVLFHYGITLDLNPNNPIAILLSHGWSGVDLFFIISGFIASHTVNIESIGLKSGIEYLIKRILRIIPLYYIVTILSAGHNIESFIDTGKSLLFIPLGGIPPDSLGPGYGGARVGQGWTLNYEMYFYLIVSLSFMFGRMKWIFVVGFMALVLITPIIIYGIPANYGFSGFNFEFVYLGLMTNPIIVEFIIGMFIYYIYSIMDGTLSITWIVVIASFIIIYFYNIYSPFVFTSRITAWAIPSALLVLGLLKLELTGKVRFNNFIMHIGNISFSIYLLHEATQGVLLKLMKKISNNEGLFSSLNARVVLFMLSLAFTYYAASISYKYIEKGLSVILRRKTLKLAL